MEFTKKDPYVKQIALYMQNKEFDRAYLLAREFTTGFKNELQAHFLLAKTAFRLKKFAEAIRAARVAFNMATTKQDMLTCAVVLSASCYLGGDSAEAYKVLGMVGGDTNPDAKQLMFVYALSVQNEQEAAQHLDRLYQINRRLAEDFIQKFF